MYESFVNTNEVDRAFDRIAQALSERTADFLFGAGMSVDSSVPAGRALANKLLHLFFPDTGTNPPTAEMLDELVSAFQFEALVQAVEQSRGNRRDDLTRDLRKLLTDPDYKPSQAHNDFLSVCFWGGSRPSINRIFTTNFDNLLEKALGGSAARITEDNLRTMPDVQLHGKIPVIYLHGTLESGLYQITEADIFDQRFRAVHAMFRSALNEADAFVFVGYSMNDPDFRALYLDYREDIALRGQRNKDTYVVSPINDPFTYDLAQTVWRTRGAVLIPLTAAAFFSRLKRILEADETAKAKNRIMTKYNLKDDKAYDDKVRQTAAILSVELADAVQFLLETRTKTGGTV